MKLMHVLDLSMNLVDNFTQCCKLSFEPFQGPKICTLKCSWIFFGSWILTQWNSWRNFWNSRGFPLLLPHIPPTSWSTTLQIRLNKFNHRVSIDFCNMDIILHVGMQGIYNLTIKNTIETSRLCWHETCTPWRSSLENIFQLIEVQLVKIHQEGSLFERKKECGMLLLAVMKVGRLLHLVWRLMLTSRTFSSMTFSCWTLHLFHLFSLIIILNMGLFFKSKFLVL